MAVGLCLTKQWNDWMNVFFYLVNFVDQQDFQLLHCISKKVKQINKIVLEY